MFLRLVSLVLPCYMLSLGYEISKQSPILFESMESAYLKLIFANGESEFIRNWECPEGVWTEDLPKRRPPSCVCVKGVFAIGTSLCDSSFKIITGNNHCFNIGGQQIRKYLPLTGKRGLKGKANTVFRADAPYFARLNSPTPVTTVTEAVDYIFRLNDKNGLAIHSRLAPGLSAKLKCLPGQVLNENSKDEPIMNIAWLPDCANEFRKSEPWCTSQMIDYQWSLRVGESWNSSTGTIEQGFRESSGGCQDRFKAKPVRRENSNSKVVKRAALPAGRKSFPSPIRKSRTHNCSFFPENVLDYVEFPSADHFLDDEASDPHPDFFSASYFQQEVNKQNRRVATFLKVFYTGGDDRLTSIPRFKDFQEFNYIRLGKELLKKVCPDEYVPGYVVDFLIRAFRILYIDSSAGYTFPLRTNEHEHNRITDALQRCTQNARPIRFVETPGCPDLGVSSTNYSVNDTDWIVHDLNRNGDDLRVHFLNESSLDIAVELVWKIVLLTHYYCTNEFTNNILDLSTYFVRVEALLKNPKIIFRWNHPGSFNRLLQFFLMAYDLQKFAEGVDHCVETVFVQSPYKKWLKRPLHLASMNPHAKPLSHDVEKYINMLNFIKPKRRKRFYFQDDIWNNKGYCMRTTRAAYTEVQTSTFLFCKKKPIWFENTD